MIRTSWAKGRLTIIAVLDAPAFAAVKATMPDRRIAYRIVDLSKGMSVERLAMPRPTSVDVHLLAKAAKRNLYLSRPVANADKLIGWAKRQGFEKTLPPADMHVTIVYSKTAVDWDGLGDSFDEVRASGLPKARKVQQLGPEGAIVLRFRCDDLSRRQQEILDKGATSSWPDYKPHVTITYDQGSVDLAKVEPYRGDIVFGPERFAEIEEDWTAGVVEQGVDGKGFFAIGPYHV